MKTRICLKYLVHDCKFAIKIFKLLHKKTKYPTELASSDIQTIWKINLRVLYIRSQKHHEVIS